MRAWGGCASSARAAAAAQHVKSAILLLPVPQLASLLVPQLASLASCGRLSRPLASLRTSVSGCGGPLAAPPPPRHEPVGRPKSQWEAAVLLPVCANVAHSAASYPQAASR